MFFLFTVNAELVTSGDSNGGERACISVLCVRVHAAHVSCTPRSDTK